ncbi:transposase [Komagataeibacter intermedius AF2]|uniref:Transposase n=1 Tax=Komagataeibacter intermedius AF2 TaxID=1458464 RepID=A0A0N0MEV1_9PROT|nr:transposase [Komagataeibacter intermedius AF2]
MNVFSVPVHTGGKARYHPRLMRALLIFSYANRIFLSRRIKRATYRDIGIRFMAANLH